MTGSLVAAVGPEPGKRSAPGAARAGGVPLERLRLLPGEPSALLEEGLMSAWPFSGHYLADHS